MNSLVSILLVSIYIYGSYGSSVGTIKDDACSKTYGRSIDLDELFSNPPYIHPQWGRIMAFTNGSDINIYVDGVSILYYNQKSITYETIIAVKFLIRNKLEMIMESNLTVVVGKGDFTLEFLAPNGTLIKDHHNFTNDGNIITQTKDTIKIVTGLDNEDKVYHNSYIRGVSDGQLIGSRHYFIFTYHCNKTNIN